MLTARQAFQLRVLRIICLIPAVLIAAFIFGSRSMSVQISTVVFWLAHLITIVSVFFVVPLARSFGRSGLLWAIGTLVFSPVGPVVACVRLMTIADESDRSATKS